MSTTYSWEGKGSYGSMYGCAGKTVKSLGYTCHTWALLRWWFTTKRRCIKCMHLYLCAIVTLSLRRAVFTLFDFNKCHYLEIWVRGHFKVIESQTIRKIVYGFLLVFFSNSVPKTHRSWDIRLKNYRDLENRVRGPSRSLEMSPCDRAHMTSFWRSIVIMALSRVVSEIFNVEKCRDIEIGVRGYSRSLKEVPFYTSGMVSC